MLRYGGLIFIYTTIVSHETFAPTNCKTFCKTAVDAFMTPKKCIQDKHYAYNIEIKLSIIRRRMIMIYDTSHKLLIDTCNELGPPQITSACGMLPARSFPTEYPTET